MLGINYPAILGLFYKLLTWKAPTRARRGLGMLRTRISLFGRKKKDNKSFGNIILGGNVRLASCSPQRACVSVHLIQRKF